MPQTTVRGKPKDRLSQNMGFTNTILTPGNRNRKLMISKLPGYVLSNGLCTMYRHWRAMPTKLGSSGRGFSLRLGASIDDDALLARTPPLVAERACILRAKMTRVPGKLAVDCEKTCVSVKRSNTYPVQPTIAPSASLYNVLEIGELSE